MVRGGTQWCTVVRSFTQWYTLVRSGTQYYTGIRRKRLPLVLDCACDEEQSKFSVLTLAENFTVI